MSPGHLVAESSVTERQGTTTKEPQTLGAERQSTTTNEPQTFGGAELYYRGRVQQPRSPRHLGVESSITERQGATTKEPQTFGGAELYYTEAEYNNQGAPDI